MELAIGSIVPLDSLTTVVAFAIVLGLAVLVHEMGHFAAAKAVGVRVLEFAVGFPPKLFTLFERNGTQYNVCALPIGGYVKLAGMEPGEEAGPDGFNGKPVWQRMVVYAAGPLMNFVLAAVVFIGMGMTVGVPVRPKAPDALVSGVMAGQPAERAGFLPGDQVVAVDGRRADMNRTLAMVRRSPGRPITITVLREGRRLNLRVTPVRNKRGQGQIGVTLQEVPVYRRVGAIRAIGYGMQATWQGTRDTVAGVVALFRDASAREGLVGPVGIARLAGEFYRQGVLRFLTFLAIISVNLGVLNLLPLLVVDGGHLTLLTLEWIRGKRLQPMVQVSMQVVGMVLILLAVVLLTVRDIGNWASGKPF